MKLEKIKSTILAILVGISLFLTYIQWTYQPSYGFIDGNDVINSVTIAKERSPEEIVVPTNLLIHRSGGTYGTGDVNKVLEVFDNIKKWKYFEVKEITHTLTDDEFLGLVHGDGKVELLFEDLVPLTFYSRILTFTADHIPHVNFDRIVIDMANFKENQVPVYFVSYQDDERKVYQTYASGNLINQFQTKYYQIPQRFPVYDYYEIEGIRRVYYPRNYNNEVTMYSYRYRFYSDNADTELFKDALFSDPRFVTTRIVDGGEEYNDSSSLMSIEYSSNTLSFVNPASESDSFLIVPDVLQKSINFVNEHAGWTDMYIYDNWAKFENKVSFRLYHQGYPVHDEKGQTTIDVIWGKDELYQYKRPLKNHFIWNLESTEFELPSGEFVIAQLAKQFDLKDLQALTIGYKVVPDSRPLVIYLEPAWFYLHAGNWLSITFDQGGDKHGLE